LPATYAAVLLAAASYSHFPIIINDVFALRWQAEHLSLWHPGSFYNGFFPVGFPLLLHASLITGNPIFALMLLQFALAIFYAAMVHRLLVRLIPGRAVAIVLPLALFAPPVIHAILSPTPDFFAAFAVLAGFLFLTGEERWNFIRAGVCVGIACLFRSHVLALVGAIAVALLLFYRKDQRLRAFSHFCLGVIPFVVVQGLVQVWSGHSFFENAQAFNIWKTMHGMDWSNPPALSHTRAFSVILENPALFFSSVWNWLLIYSFYIVPLIAAMILSLVPNKRYTFSISKQLILLAIVALVYIFMTAAGGSVSAFTPVIPVIAASLAYLIEAVFGQMLRSRAWVVPTLTAVFWSASLTGLFILTLRNAERIEDYAKIDSQLHVYSSIDGPAPNTNESQTDALRIYTDDYDFYFPDLHYRTPRFSGGWPEVGFPSYLKEFPHIHNSNAEIEHEDLMRNGIQWVIYRLPPYDATGYANVRDDTTLFRLMYRTTYHEIYRVEGSR
jgi:hypothetical protein